MSKLLPNEIDNFKDKNYWNNFFKERDVNSFEWYAEWENIKDYLIKDINKKNKILIIGCGNSNLSNEMYKNGFTNQINIDYSDLVIEQMKKMYSNLEYIQMDVTKMNFDDNSFDIVLDKACLDAILCNDKQDVLDSVTQMMNEIKRVLKSDGKYLCISLLQSHVVKKLLIDYNKWNIDISIILVNPGESALCPFYIKFQNNKDAITMRFIPENGFIRKNDNTLINKENINENIENTCNKIIETQFYYSKRHSLEKIGNELCYETDLFLYNEDYVFINIYIQPRYHISVYDNKYLHIDTKPKIGVFIIPQGKEDEWIYHSDEGKNKIVYQSGYHRLIFISIYRKHFYNTLEEVQKELNPFIPQYYTLEYEESVPFFTSGDDIGTRYKLIFIEI